MLAIATNANQELRRLGGRVRAAPASAALGTALAAAMLWVYWPTLIGLANRWATDAKYSHGYLVPLFSLFLLWMRRELASEIAFRSSAWGWVFLAGGLGLRGLGAYYYYPWFGDISLLPLAAGLTLLLGSWQALRWAWPAIAFLTFMLPLPYRLEIAMGYPLQRMATLGSVYCLQTLGFVAHADGTTIQMKDLPQPLGIVEACNGLSMLLIFFALSTAVVILMRRPWIDRLVILLSAVPIAMICNVFRITTAGVLYVTSGQWLAEEVFHQRAGWLMMVVALALMWLEIKILGWVFIEPERDPLRNRTLRASILASGDAPAVKT